MRAARVRKARAGPSPQPPRRGHIRVRECEAGARCRALVDFEIDFPSAAVGRQAFSCAFDRETFRREIAPARTFGFLKEAEQLRAAGYGRGADLTNTLVIDGDALMNPALQRFPDEFVRHKILDAVGDLKLAGFPVIARFEGRKSSHALNNQLLRALFADPANYRIEPD